MGKEGGVEELCSEFICSRFVLIFFTQAASKL